MILRIISVYGATAAALSAVPITDVLMLIGVTKTAAKTIQTLFTELSTVKKIMFGYFMSFKDSYT